MDITLSSTLFLIYYQKRLSNNITSQQILGITQSMKIFATILSPSMVAQFQKIIWIKQSESPQIPCLIKYRAAECTLVVSGHIGDDIKIVMGASDRSLIYSSL